MAELRAALDFLSGVVITRTTLPILTHVRLIGGDDELVVVAHNLDFCATRAVALSEGGALDVAANAARLKAFLAAAPKGADFGMEEVDGRVRLSVARARLDLSTLPGGDFPGLIGDAISLDPVDGAAAAASISSAMLATSHEEVRYYLNGVHLAGDVVVATNGHVLATAPAFCKATGPILPNAALGPLVALLGAAEGETASIGFSEAAWRADAPGVSLRGKLIDGAFPDFRSVMPHDPPPWATVEAADLAAALRRTELGSRRDAVVLETTGDGELRLKALAEGGAFTAEDAIACEVHAELRIGLNRGYLASMLKAVGSEIVELRVKGPADPVLMTPVGPDFEGRIAVLMPYRI